MSLSVNIINRKKLLVDTDIEHTTGYVETLKAAKIPYELQTKLLRSPAGMRTPSSPAHNFYVYTIYVRRKHFKNAAQLLHL